jgi:serine/threonine protein kinase
VTVPEGDLGGGQGPVGSGASMSSTDRQVYSGRYELERKVARGGMADVFLSRDLLLDRPVALKVLFPEFASDPAFVQRFRREAQSAARLTHPNVVSVFDWGQEGSTYFIVMEFVEGQSLAQLLRESGRMDPDRAAAVAADVADALAFAHEHGVVHRDVKPGNVMLSRGGHVKVADFGIARAVSTVENLTQTGTVMGTATYFSPEQARGGAVDPRSDVYSLGVVLYEMVTGTPPFTGDNPVSVAYKHVPCCRCPRAATSPPPCPPPPSARPPPAPWPTRRPGPSPWSRGRSTRPPARPGTRRSDDGGGAGGSSWPCSSSCSPSASAASCCCARSGSSAPPTR